MSILMRKCCFIISVFACCAMLAYALYVIWSYQSDRPLWTYIAISLYEILVFGGGIYIEKRILF